MRFYGGVIQKATITPKQKPIVSKKKNKTIINNRGVNLQRLAYSVRMHETANCTKGSANVNNCYGIMTWKNGKRYFRRFTTKEESTKYFIKLWADHYGGMPTLAMARRYSGTDRAEAWLYNVLYFYHKK